MNFVEKENGSIVNVIENLIYFIELEVFNVNKVEVKFLDVSDGLIRDIVLKLRERRRRRREERERFFVGL